MAQLIPFPENTDFKRQAVVVPGTERPGQTGHYRNAIWNDLITDSSPQPYKTLLDLWETGLNASRNEPCLGHRPVVSQSPLKFGDYVWQTFAEVDARKNAVGSAIHALFASGKLQPAKDGLETVGIWCGNRPEWQIVDLGLHAYRKVGVSLYDTLGADSVEYIINHAEISIIFSSPQHIPALLTLASSCPTLKMIVSMDDLQIKSKEILQAWGKDKKVEIAELSQLEAAGREKPLEMIRPTPSDIATICYTSGTTNMPKGVVITHSQMTIACTSNFHGSSFEKKGSLLSYLPLAHIYERFCELIALGCGHCIGYWSGDTLRLIEDAQVLRPTFFPSVPRVLNKIYMAALASLNAPGVKGALLRKATEVKLKELRATGNNKHAFWDRVVFRKIQAVLGGQVQFIGSGSAPIATDALDFLKIAFACDVVEGYGMTENCGTCLRVWPGDPTSTGTVGAPQPCNEIKLVDVPTMGYTSQDKPYPRGEICVRGGNCFTQYYKDEKNTKETIDTEGWLHTGDVGSVDEAGRFRIIDRVKNIMKLSQGEYVALEKIENTYSICPIVAQIFVHGDSLRDHLLAVVVPDPAILCTLANQLGVGKFQPTDVQGLEKILNDPRIVQGVLDELTKEGKKKGLKGFEMAKKVHLTMEPFTPENGLLTPTLKLKRKDAYKRHKEPLDKLYGL
jgi:long-chain acyl-CoA synthetase